MQFGRPALVRPGVWEQTTLLGVDLATGLSEFVWRLNDAQKKLDDLRDVRKRRCSEVVFLGLETTDDNRASDSLEFLFGNSTCSESDGEVDQSAPDFGRSKPELACTLGEIAVVR